jgi:NTE family protein
MASGALPPGFPPIEIGGEFYWDGGVVSNTPLQWVLDSRPCEDTLAFQVDLWSARGEVPCDITEVDVRTKDIRYSSRTRLGTDQFKRMQKLRRAIDRLMKEPPGDRRNDPELKLIEAESDEKVYNIVHLIYHARKYEGVSKDIEFSRRTMEERRALEFRL